MIHLMYVESPAFYTIYMSKYIYIYKRKGGRRESHPKSHFEVTARIIAMLLFIAMAQEHPFGKCGKFQKSPLSPWSFIPLLFVCTKTNHITAISLLFPLLLPLSKPLQLKKKIVTCCFFGLCLNYLSCMYIFVGEVCEPGFCLKLVVSVSKYGLGNMLFS